MYEWLGAVGKWSDEGTATEENCIGCDAGQWMDTDKECQPCNPGETSTTNAVDCTSCPECQYTNSAQTECETCPSKLRRHLTGSLCI